MFRSGISALNLYRKSFFILQQTCVVSNAYQHDIKYNHGCMHCLCDLFFVQMRYFLWIIKTCTNHYDNNVLNPSMKAHLFCAYFYDDVCNKVVINCIKCHILLISKYMDVNVCCPWLFGHEKWPILCKNLDPFLSVHFLNTRSLPWGNQHRVYTVNLMLFTTSCFSWCMNHSL